VTDPQTMLVLASTILIVLALAGSALLAGWRGWLELKRLELGARGMPAGSSPAARIELADLRERVRKLEAIAEGTEN
jgi:hypothetical protein